MKSLLGALRQAMILAASAFIVGLIYNSFNENGIHPIRKPLRVPVIASNEGGAQAGEGIRIIDIEEAKNFVASGGRVLDARTKESYDEGHIPGAILFDYYSFGTYRARVLPMLSRQETIMVYCSEPSCDDSELLAKELYALGFRNLLLFKGGFAGWVAAGLEVEMTKEQE